MEKNTLENGLKTICMDKEQQNGQMVIPILGNFQEISVVVMVFLNGQMEKYLKEFG